MLRRIVRRLNRGAAFLLKNSCLDISEKATVLMSGNRDAVLRRLVMKRLVEDGPASYFSIGGYKIYFQPDYEIHDREYFMRGITTVLTEAFLFPDYFNAEVYAKKGDVILDLGASIGATALLFSKAVGESGRVFSFEPVTFDVIRTNIAKNNINNVEVIPKGVSNEAGKAEIEISEFCVDSSMAKREYTKGYYTRTRAIDTVSLDSFADETGLDRIDFIKMDVEGSEELVIRGAGKVIDKYRPKWSISSYHIGFDNKPQHETLVRLLKEKGYDIEEKGKNHIYAW